MAAVTICSDFGAPKNEVFHCFHCFPIYLPWSDGTRCHKESWVPKNWCFWTVVLEKTLESPLDCKAIKPVNPEYSLEGLMLKLKLQYFGHLIWRADSLGKTLMLAKTEGRRRGWQRLRWLMVSFTQWVWVSESSRRCWRTGKPGMLQSMGSQRVRHNWVTELDWMALLGLP